MAPGFSQNVLSRLCGEQPDLSEGSVDGGDHYHIHVRRSDGALD